MQGFPVLIGSYAGNPENGISPGHLDAASGILFLGPACPAPHPSWLCASPDARHLAAVVETDVWADRAQGAVGWYEMLPGGDETPPVLRFRTCTPIPSLGPCHALLHGSRLIVCGYSTGIVTSMPLDDALHRGSTNRGHTGHVTACVRADIEFPGGTAGVVSHAHQAVAAPDGQHLAIVDLGQDAVFLVDAGLLAEAGAVSLASLPFPASRLDLPTGCGPRHLTFSRDGRHAYLCGEYDNHLYALAYEPHALRILSRTSTLPSDAGSATASFCAAIRLSPEGRFVLVSNRGHDSIAVFPLDAHGNPGTPRQFTCGGHWPRDIAFSPDGRFLLCANQRSDLVTVLAWDEAAGTLALVAAAPCDSPTSVLFV